MGAEHGRLLGQIQIASFVDLDFDHKNFKRFIYILVYTSIPP
jgi:hypothetical protein